MPADCLWQDIGLPSEVSAFYTHHPSCLFCMQPDGTYKGFLSVSFNGTPGGQQGATCGDDSWSWPVIDEINVLGVGPVNGDSITVQVREGYP